MQYHQHAPLMALRLCVESVWTLEGEAGADDEPQAVLPDGRPELIVHLGDPFAAGGDLPAQPQPPIVFAGQLTSRLLLRPRGTIRIVGIRFHPHGAAALMRVPQHLAAGMPMPLEDLDSRAWRELRAARERAAGSDLASAALALQDALVRCLLPERVDARLVQAADAIGRARGLVSIERLAASVNMTRRHLERRFLDDVGLTPKRLARVTRFQRALRMLEDDEVAGRVAHAALACGYADQPHFVRDFRALAGCAPSEHLLQRAELTGFFIAGASGRTSARERQAPRRS